MVPILGFLTFDYLLRMFCFFHLKRGPAAYMGVFVGARNHNSEVYRDGINNVSPRKDGKYFASKARYVARTASIEIKTSAAPPLCVRRVLQYNSRGSTPLIIICGV